MHKTSAILYISRMSSLPREILGAHVLGTTRRQRHLAAYERGPALSSASGNGLSLLYLTAGRVHFRFADGTVHLRTGDVLSWNGAFLERRTDPQRPLSYWVISLVPLGAAGIMTLEETGLPRVCAPKNRAALEHVFSRLHLRFLGKEPGWRQDCSIMGLKILRALAVAPQGTGPDSSGPDNRFLEKRIRDVLDFINLNYKKRIGVSQLARMATAHPNHFNRLFKRVTGLSPHRYILEKKVEKAKDFLIHFGETPAAVALELGFHDPAHFSRVFKKLEGMAPGRFLAMQGLGRRTSKNDRKIHEGCRARGR
jgi:AraC-like DNA-binding protein